MIKYLTSLLAICVTGAMLILFIETLKGAEDAEKDINRLIALAILTLTPSILVTMIVYQTKILQEWIDSNN